MNLRRSVDVRSLPLFGRLVRAYQDRFTSRGRGLLWALAALGAMGLDTLSTRIFVLFAIAAGLLLAATAFSFRRRPKVSVSGGIPVRATAGTPVTFRLGLDAPAGCPDLSVAFPTVRGITFTPAELAVAVEAGRRSEVAVTMRPERRGRYPLRSPRLGRTDPLGLIATRPAPLPDSVLLVYPRFFTLERFEIPLGRRHQPGGVPLSASTGDSVEFIGTRDYREGDPIRHIHWRSWARRGVPVVKEHQEEYFCRIAIVLDTFLPERRQDAAFEASVSVVASIADFFSRSEYIVDILAAGPDVYEVSAGRSLGYLENILDVLACIEPCPAPPFKTIGPVLFDRLAQLSTVVVILQDWDAPRREFLEQVRSSGTAVRVIIVRDGPTREDWRELGEVEVMAPADVERALR